MKERNISLIKVAFNDGIDKNIPEDTSLFELCKDFEGKITSKIFAAKVNNDIKELSYRLNESCNVKFIELKDDDGIRIYQRSLYFILIKAVNDLYPDRKVVIGHSISKGIYCEIKNRYDEKLNLTEQEVANIQNKMRELVDAKIPFIKQVMPTDDAKKIFKESGRLDRYYAIEYRMKPYVSVYTCDGLDDYFYGYMAPDTSYVDKFALKYYPPGLIMLYPHKTNTNIIPEFKEQRKLFDIFQEYTKWGRILGVDHVGALNNIVEAGEINSLIRISEALHEKKIAQIADMITNSKYKKRVVLISGPSSSGKTTFAHRLAIQLRVNGLKPVTISLDNYFVDREKTPIDEDGEYDYEAFEAIDVNLFNQHLGELIDGKEVELPIFNFSKGTRESIGQKMKIEDDQIIIIEGIHGLNPKLTSSIENNNKFKIYVSALTSMNIDEHNRIPSTDTRIIRRIVRDFQFRGCSAINTIKRWPSVRRGEEKNIFPFEEEADIMFNSSLVYELGILKTLAEPLLGEITRKSPEYSEARRLIEFLGYFLPIESNEIPLNSIIKEFMGGSCFY